MYVHHIYSWLYTLFVLDTVFRFHFRCIRRALETSIHPGAAVPQTFCLSFGCKLRIMSLQLGLAINLCLKWSNLSLANYLFGNLIMIIGHLIFET